MHDFIKAFLRDGHGAWRCIAPASIDLPSGRIQVVPGSVFVRGTRFMNVDLAVLLEEQHQKYGKREETPPRGIPERDEI